MSVCGVCKRYLGLFNREFKCSVCNTTLCADCVVKTKIEKRMAYLIDKLDFGYDYSNPFFGQLFIPSCPSCFEQVRSQVKALNRAINDHSDVEVVSENYKGYKPVDRNGVRKDIKTYYHKDSNNALDELKTLAKCYGCDMVIDVSRTYRVEEEESDSGKGVYKFKVWSYSGTACQRYNKRK